MSERSPRVKRGTVGPLKMSSRHGTECQTLDNRRLSQPESLELGVVSFVQIVHGSLVTAIELVVWEVAFRGPQSSQQNNTG